MNIEIRRAVIGDSDEICRINTEDLGYDFPPEQSRKKLLQLLESPADRIFVAVADGCVVGYVHANDYDTLYFPHLKNIMGIAVSAPYRHNGVGSALLNAVEQWAVKSGAAGIRLTSGKSRTGAHEFYRILGYKSDGEKVHFMKYF